MVSILKMVASKIPFISFVIPTLNAERTLDLCLSSIFSQDYPRNRYEVLVVDGGSTDRTLDIAKKYPIRMLNNAMGVADGKFGGRAQCVNVAKGDIVAFVDADNELSSSHWLKCMVKPFIDNPLISVCNPKLLLKRRSPAIKRYAFKCTNIHQMLFSINPRMATIKDTCDKGDYIVADIREYNRICLFNGALVRKKHLDDVGGFDFDFETAMRLVRKGYNEFAFSKTQGIYHHDFESLGEWVKKQVVRMRRFLYFKTQTSREDMLSYYIPKNRLDFLTFFKRAFNIISILGPLMFTARMIKEDGDVAWLYHPLITIIGLLIFLASLAYSSGRRVLRQILSGTLR